MFSKQKKGKTEKKLGHCSGYYSPMPPFGTAKMYEETVPKLMIFLQLVASGDQLGGEGSVYLFTAKMSKTVRAQTGYLKISDH